MKKILYLILIGCCCFIFFISCGKERDLKNLNDRIDNIDPDLEEFKKEYRNHVASINNAVPSGETIDTYKLNSDDFSILKNSFSNSVLSQINVSDELKAKIAEKLDTVKDDGNYTVSGLQIKLESTLNNFLKTQKKLDKKIITKLDDMLNFEVMARDYRMKGKGKVIDLKIVNGGDFEHQPKIKDVKYWIWLFGTEDIAETLYAINTEREVTNLDFEKLIADKLKKDNVNIKTIGKTAISEDGYSVKYIKDDNEEGSVKYDKNGVTF